MRGKERGRIDERLIRVSDVVSLVRLRVGVCLCYVLPSDEDPPIRPIVEREKVVSG